MLDSLTQICFASAHYLGIVFIVTSAQHIFSLIYTAHCIVTQHTIKCYIRVFANVETECVHIISCYCIYKTVIRLYNFV